MNIKLDVDLANKTTDTIVANTLNNPNHKNIIIDAIYLMSNATTDTVKVTLTTDSKFKDVYKLSDDIIDNITKASGVKAYLVSYVNFARKEHLSNSMFSCLLIYQCNKNSVVSRCPIGHCGKFLQLHSLTGRSRAEQHPCC